MKRDKKKPTTSQVDTSMLMTGEELHSLDAICAGLVDATDKLQKKNGKNKGYLAFGNADNIDRHKAPKICDLPSGRFTLGELSDEMRTSLTAAYRSGDTYKRDKLLAYWLYFVYQAAIPLLQKKHQIATTLGKHDAAKKIEDVFVAIPPLNKIDHPNGWADIKNEAKHFADKITLEGFYLDICKAFRLDAEATNEINNGNDHRTAPKNTKERRRYPHDAEALNVLQEAARRKACKSYSDDSNAAIIKHMINEPQSKWASRILYGKLKGKASGQVRQYAKPRNADKTAETWGKYLSEYRKDHPPKQGA